MPEYVKCPRCGEEIAYLDVRSEERIYYRFDHKGHTEVDREKMGPEGMYFDCPKCGDTVARTEEKAMAFLLIEQKGDGR